MNNVVEPPFARFRVDVNGQLKQFTWSAETENWNMYLSLAYDYSIYLYFTVNFVAILFGVRVSNELGSAHPRVVKYSVHRDAKGHGSSARHAHGAKQCEQLD
ncbi:hypothetical protein V6N11_034632 [Hibiscus sabdariffa]|uniref:Uncharacterized protein n=1 Tax=Hibiscus sabdariffa TaxID=183260 RepID=A0ABR2NDR6_9ROSI